MAADAGWRRVRLGAQEALVRRSGGALVAFGIGPARRAAPARARAAALLAALGPARAVRWCRQVHGRAIASLAHEPGRPPVEAGCVGRCDGMVTDEPGLVLLVWTADCVPVALVGGGVVAMVHAGWRGTAAGIVAAAVRRVEVEYGVPPEELAAYLGPAVGPCHYQVGPEVVAALAARGVPESAWLEGDRVDLGAVVAGELVRCGVPRERVERVSGCTACDPELASYRRDGEAAGRQPSFVVLEERALPLS